MLEMALPWPQTSSNIAENNMSVHPLHKNHELRDQFVDLNNYPKEVTRLTF